MSGTHPAHRTTPLPSPGIESYEHLCTPATLDELRRLRGRLDTHVDVVAEAALADGSLPIGLAQELATGLTDLLDDAESFDAEGRHLIRAAAVYFLMTDDAANDLGGPHGLHDDLEVYNDVCARLGQPARAISL